MLIAEHEIIREEESDTAQNETALAVMYKSILSWLLQAATGGEVFRDVKIA